MRQLKLLLAAIALLCAMPCWGKPIDLHGQWKHKKSIKVKLPMDASIEEASGELRVNFHEDVGLVRITVVSESGDIVYNDIIQTSETPIWTLFLEGLCEKGALSITDEENNVHGDFSI